MKKDKLTREEIQLEIDKIRNFFDNVPDDLKMETALHFICEIVLWGSYCHFDALGIFEEAKMIYRENSLENMQDDEEENEGNIL
jgi:hypothetical protein